MELVSKEEVIKALKKFETVKELGSFTRGTSTCSGQACVAYIEGGRTNILWAIDQLKTYDIEEKQ